MFCSDVAAAKKDSVLITADFQAKIERFAFYSTAIICTVFYLLFNTRCESGGAETLSKYFGLHHKETRSNQSIRLALLKVIPQGSRRDEVLNFIKDSGCLADNGNCMTVSGDTICATINGPNKLRHMADILYRYTLKFNFDKQDLLNDISVKTDLTGL